MYLNAVLCAFHLYSYVCADIIHARPIALKNWGKLQHMCADAP